MKPESLKVRTPQKRQAVDLTERVQSLLVQAGAADGLCHIFVQHTTAALAIGEMGEGTGEDLLDVAEKMIPAIRFRHAHNPGHAPAHMASSIIGPSVTVPVIDGKLALGTWQSILLLELDGPRDRSVIVQVLP